MQSGKLFTQDFSVLFGNGAWADFGMETPVRKANTLARLAIYGASGIAVYFKDPRYLLVAVLVLVVLGLMYHPDKTQIPMNNGNATYSPYRATSIDRVHDRSLAPSRAAQREALKASVLSNVRELNHYMGGNFGVPDTNAGEELMFGGTRPWGTNNSRAIREQRFFTAGSNAAQNGVTYTSVIPVHEI